jgi:hypothetical protein
MDESETELSGNEAVVEQLIYERIEKAIWFWKLLLTASECRQ